MHLRHLEYFIVLASELNFTQAAKSLYIAQSALSQQIAEMESRMGVKLFYRDKRTVRLTEAGAYFLKEATEIVKRYDAAVKRTQDIAAGVTGTLTIGFFGPCIKRFLPGFIRDFAAAHPRVNLVYVERTHKQLMEGLKNNEIDLILTMQMGSADGSEIRWQTIYEDDTVVVLNKDHPLAGRDTIDLRLLKDEKFFFIDREVSPNGYYSRMKLCENAGFLPKEISEVHSLDTMLWLAEANVGVSIVPKALEHNASPNLRFLTVEGAPSIFALGVAHTVPSSNSQVPAFLESMKQTIEQDPELQKSRKKLEMCLA